MTRIASDIVRQHFDAGICDVTPAPVSSAACVLYMPASGSRKFSQSCESVLSEAEARRAENFKSQDDANRFIQRRAFRRYCAAVALGSSQSLHHFGFSETHKGRPYISDQAETWFSFSSCQSGFLGAWSSSHGVGVDLEDPSRSLKPIDIAEQFFTEKEVKNIKNLRGQERLKAFFQHWNLKEAALKSIGEGLPFGLDTFEFELTPSPKPVQAPLKFGGAACFDAHLIGTPNSCAAVVIRQLD